MDAGTCSINIFYFYILNKVKNLSEDDIWWVFYLDCLQLTVFSSTESNSKESLVEESLKKYISFNFQNTWLQCTTQKMDKNLFSAFPDFLLRLVDNFPMLYNPPLTELSYRNFKMANIKIWRHLKSSWYQELKKNKKWHCWSFLKEWWWPEQRKERRSGEGLTLPVPLYRFLGYHFFLHQSLNQGWEGLGSHLDSGLV